ncbi:MAG: MBL fold metallo-hydrolase [Pseudomonadota bacterium]
MTQPDAIPFVKTFDFAYGRVDDVAPGVRRLIAENPGPFTYTGSGTYIVSNETFTSPAAIIDPGPDLPSHLDGLMTATADFGISHIVVTHTHSDHCGGARALAARCGAPIYAASEHPVADRRDDAPALDEGADYTFAPDHALADGTLLNGDGWTLETVATPGHLSNHLCFGLTRADQSILFTGDHMMGWATTVIVPPDGHMGDYFASLEKLLARPDDLYLPTHGAPIEAPHRFVRAVRAHRRMRDGQILTQMRDGKTQIADIVAVLYASVDKRLHVAAGLNVLAHLIHLCETGKVICEGEPSLTATFRLSDDDDQAP